MDFSNYSVEHPLYSPSLKKVPGYFKDKCGGAQITAFIGLRSKMYAFKVQTSQGTVVEKKVAKGIRRHVLEQELSFEKYKRALLELQTTHHEFASITSKSHSVFTLRECKAGLSPFDDKRYLVSLTDSLPYGHREITGAEGVVGE